MVHKLKKIHTEHKAVALPSLDMLIDGIQLAKNQKKSLVKLQRKNTTTYV